jgi:hypothetical protein
MTMIPLEVDTLVRNIEMLAEELQPLDMNAVLLGKFESLCQLRRTPRDAIVLLSNDIQALVVRALSRFSRSKGAFARLATCNWQILLEKLAIHFGHVPLASRDFIGHLDRVATAAAANTEWALVWSHMQTAQQKRRAQGGESNYRRGVILKEVWVPHDFTAAGIALGVNMSRVKLMARSLLLKHDIYFRRTIAASRDIRTPQARSSWNFTLSCYAAALDTAAYFVCSLTDISKRSRTQRYGRTFISCC